MRPRKHKGEVATIVLVVLALAGASQLVPNFRVTNWFKPKPPTKELVQAQADLEKAKASAAAAAAELQRVKDEGERRTKEQLQYGQQMVAGIPPALAGAEQTAEVKLATSLAQRAELALAAAVGDLPADKRAEIIRIVDGALSKLESERDAAQKALAARDAELAATTATKKALEAQLPALESRLKAKEAEVEQKTQAVAQDTLKLTQYAQRAYEREKEAGGLGATVEKLFWLIGLLVAGYALIHFVLPSLAQEFPAVSALQAINKATKAITSSHL